MQTSNLDYIIEFIEYLDSLYYFGYSEELKDRDPDGFLWEYEHYLRTYFC